MSYTNPWKDEAKVALLKQLYAEGHSASHIAARIGGVSRNAVIGKAHRLGLTGDPVVQRRMSQRSRAKRTAASKQARWRRPMTSRLSRVAELLAAEPFTPEPEIAIPVHERKTLLQLSEKDCRWPIGDGPYHFCGRQQVPGLPYCSHHSRRAYQTPQVAARQRAAPAQPVSTNASRSLEEV